MVVFGDGSHDLAFPHIELMLVSSPDGIYIYTFGTS